MSKKAFAKMLSIAATLAAYVYIWACVSTWGGTVPEEEIRALLYFAFRPWELVTSPKIGVWYLLCGFAAAGLMDAVHTVFSAVAVWFKKSFSYDAYCKARAHH